VGPTGTGKSTLLANLIIQDISAGRGVVVLDPKGDLVGEVLTRVPEERHRDVLVIDPSQSDFPVGLNLLDIGREEHARELAVDHLTGVMASLWRSSWGPRTGDVIRNGLLTLTHSTAADGSPFTLVELPELLLNTAFRRFVTKQPTVPDSVRSFWTGYEQMSDGERAQVIGPSLNKLRSFTTRTALRLMLGQAHGVRLREVFTERRVILVNLAKGSLGAETTALVGSLVMAGLWQATQARVSVAPEHRHPVFVYLDEFQDFLRLNIDLADMLAQARGLGVGLVLAHQYLGQLTDDVKTAVLGTARTQAVFQVEYDDATTLAKRFPPLTQADLSGLAAFEVALRPCVDGATLDPVTGRTLPLPDPVTDGAAFWHGPAGSGLADHEPRWKQPRVGGSKPELPRSEWGGSVEARHEPPCRPRCSCRRRRRCPAAPLADLDTGADKAAGMPTSFWRFRMTAGPVDRSVPARVRPAHVDWVASRLSARDRDIVEIVNRLRVVSSTQLSRLFFADLRAGRSRTTARTRALRRLVAWRVLCPLERRTGGHGGGSGAQCYALDSTGQRQAEDAGGRVRRPGAPGQRTLRHILGVSELYVSLVELGRTAGFTVAAFEAEPGCWWPNGLGGRLKPDAYALLACGTVRDHWWLEHDQAEPH